MTQKKRAKILYDVLSDVNSWDSWIIDYPERFATLLGLCSDGVPAIKELTPALTDVQNIFLKRNNQNNHNISSNPLNEKIMADKSGREEAIIKGVETLLGFLDRGLKEKKKKDKLSALVSAWERCGKYKDLFIQAYMNDKINDENKKKAAAVYDDLLALQEALKDLRKEIDREDEEGIEEQKEKAQKLADEILGGLVML